MAKITNTAGSSNIWLGSKGNTRQSIVYVPADTTAGSGSTDKPGLLFLESIASAGGASNLGGLYVFARNANTLAISSTYPTDEASSGTTLGAATGASLALDNLVSVQIGNTGDLIPANDNQVTLGDATHGFSTAYLSTSLVFYESTQSLTVTASDQTSQAVTANFPDVSGTSATADVMLDSGAANVIRYEKGTSTINFAANADLDIATGITVNIDNTTTIQGNTSITAGLTVGGTVAIGTGGLAIGTGAVAFVGTCDYNQATGVTVDINGGLTVGTGGLTTSTTAVTLDQDLQASASPTFAVVTTQGITNTSAVIDTTAQLQVGADNVYLTLGQSDESDSRIYFDGVGNLRFFDSNTSVAYTLQQLATGTTLNPTVTGNLTISDGNFTWGNSATNEAAVWTLAATSTDAIQIVAATSTAKTLSITSDDCANGSLLYLDADGGVGSSGYFIECYDATDSPFLVGQGGALTMASTSNISNKISRNNASGATPVLEIEETNAAGDVALLVDSDHTGAVNGMQITYLGTTYALNVDMGAAAGAGINITQSGIASGTKSYLNLDGATGTSAWIGAAATGMLQINSDGNLADVDAHLVQIDNSGTVVAATTGSCIHVTEASSGGGTGASAVYITSSTQDALHVAAGTVNIDSYMDIDSYVALTASDALSQHALVITQEDTNASKDGLQISFASDGRGLYVTNTKVDGTNAVFATGIANTTDPNVLIDGSTANWIGASNGMLHLKADTELAATDGSLLFIDYEAGATSKDNAAGSCLRITDQSGAGGGTEYAMYLSSTNNAALHVASGATQLAGTLTMTAAADIAIAEGKLTVDSTVNETSHVKRNQATVNSAVMEIEDSDTSAGTGIGLLIDVNGTGNSTGLQISHSGDYPVIDIDAGAARNGNVIDIAMANQLAETALDITGAATGTNGEGIVHIDVTGTMVGDGFRVDSTGTNAATASLFKGISTGAQGGATAGIVAAFTDTGAQASTSYTVYIASTSNEALHVDAGKVQIDEDVTVGVNTTGNAGHVDIWDGTGGSAPSYVMLASPDGTQGYFFMDDNGKLRHHTSIPTATSDGTVVGDQTSTS